MKKSLFLLPLLGLLFVNRAESADLTGGSIAYSGITSNASYAIRHATITVSSNTASAETIPAVAGYRKVVIDFDMTLAQLASGTSIYFAMSGSTTGVYTSGYVVFASTPSVYDAVHKIPVQQVVETNSAIKMLTGPGIGNVSGRYTEYRKNN